MVSKLLRIEMVLHFLPDPDSGRVDFDLVRFLVKYSTEQLTPQWIHDAMGYGFDARVEIPVELIVDPDFGKLVARYKADDEGMQPPSNVIPTSPNQSEIRTWAKSRGIAVPARGRIPKAVMDRYQSSGARLSGQ